MNPNQAYIAQKYAKAFYHKFDDKINQGQIDKIRELIMFLSQNRDPLLYIELDFIDKDMQIIFIKKIILKFHLIEEFEKLLILLGANKRIYLLLQILNEIICYYNLKHNIIEFNITTSHKISEENLLKIEKFLHKNINKNIIYKFTIDNYLIAGIKMYSDSLGWHHSIRQQLNNLRNAYKDNL